MTQAISPQEFTKVFNAFEESIGRFIVGNQGVIRACFAGLMADGNILLEGVPGLGKTALVSAIGDALHLSFGRIQFTPDLMPADITGTKIIVESQGGGRELRLQKGPIFHHVVLADEINRATPKTQSALLEAMQERQVTVLGETLPLPSPFFVVATQNPLEMEGTYPLPEAQLDRFLMKVMVPFPNAGELAQILDRTTGSSSHKVEAVCDGEQVLSMRALVREIPVATELRDIAIRMILASHPDRPEAVEPVKRFVRYGAGPRGAQALMLTGKARALMEGRLNVSLEDLAKAAKPVLRHRMGLNFEGEAENINPDTIVQAILDSVMPKRRK